jgi:hypothetical protein
MRPFPILVLTVLLPALAVAETKVLICPGDYGMCAQDRVPLIRDAVERAAPGRTHWESEQAFNFVKKLENPGYAERFDVIVAGDIALGQMSTKAQESLVRFVNNGGGFIYVICSKSTIGRQGPKEIDPLPLAAILPYAFPDTAKPREGATAMPPGHDVLKGLDFSTTPLVWPAKPGAQPPQNPTFLMEGAQGKGHVLVLYGAFGPSYKYISYAKFEKLAGGWDIWPQLGDLWVRLLDRAAAASPVKDQTRAQVDAAVKTVPLGVTASIDATREIGDIRAANFSIVALQQLYNEDGGAGEDLFLDLNPRDFFDRRSQEVLANTKGKFPDKTALFRQYNIKGIIMGNNSYNSFGQWDDAKFNAEVASYVAAARKYPDILTYFQPGNEPHCNEAYFKFHNRINKAMIDAVPAIQTIGPNTPFNIVGPGEKEMKDFIDTCGATTDVLNWHIYARCPETVVADVKYWAAYAQGKLRAKGPVKVMFTESDAWNTRDSQFNYLMERGFLFLTTPEIIASFQYCMRPRYEGGSYWFGVLQPDNTREFAANYNGYWIWRNLRGKMVQTQLAPDQGTPPSAAAHCRVLASSADGGKTVTAIVYFDHGYVEGTRRADQATVRVQVKLPAGTYKLQQSDAAWNVRNSKDAGGTVTGTANIELKLDPCRATALTWTRQ